MDGQDNNNKNAENEETNDEVLAVVYLDDGTEPILSLRPPVRFELNTNELEDGEHVLRIEAHNSNSRTGVRLVPFTVRNGPGITVSGIHENSVVEGKVPVLVNFYGGSGEAQWEPSRAETPSPVPTWAWVLFIAIAAFGVFYGVRMWNPPARFAATPTFGTPNAAGAANMKEAAAPPPPPANAQPADGANAELAAMEALGKEVYTNNCAACHQANGQGLPSTFPPLAGDPVVNAADPTDHIKIVLDGLRGKAINGTAYGSPMPAWKTILSDEQIAAVINHERASWGNHAPAVTAKDVAKLREAK